MKKLNFAIALLVVLAACKDPGISTSTSEKISEVDSRTLYRADHASYNNATSYVSGTLTGLQYSTFSGGEKLNGKSKTVTFHGLLAEKIRWAWGIGGSGDLTATGQVTIFVYQQNAGSWVFSRDPNSWVKFGGAGAQPGDYGIVTGSLSSSAVITFDNKPFRVLGPGGYWDFTDVPNGAGFVTNTNSQ